MKKYFNKFKNLISRKSLYIAIAIFVSLVSFSVVYAAQYRSISVNFSQTHYAPDMYYLEPGSSLTVTGTLEWDAGFNSPLPAMGLGAPGLGYIPADYPMTCTASGGVGGGNSNGSSICERTFNSTVAGSGTASFTINVSPGAPRGEVYSLGLTSNGGSNVKEKNFNIRVTPADLPACTVNTFTCSSNTLAWSTSNCYNVFVKGPTPSSTATISTSSTGSAGPVSSGTYLLYGPDGMLIKAATTCSSPVPVLEVTAEENVTAAPGQTITIPFEFKNDGEVGSTIRVDGNAGCTATTSGGISIVAPGIDCETRDLIK
jgi:hypothetical protein